MDAKERADRARRVVVVRELYETWGPSVLATVLSGIEGRAVSKGVLVGLADRNRADLAPARHAAPSIPKANTSNPVARACREDGLQAARRDVETVIDRIEVEPTAMTPNNPLPPRKRMPSVRRRARTAQTLIRNRIANSEQSRRGKVPMTLARVSILEGEE